MIDVVNVIVTCAKDKRHAVADDCQLRNVPGTSVQERIHEWQARTNRHWNTSVRVADLYAGDHWATVRAFDSSRFGLDVWVCSAGYGLIHFDDCVAPYAATFSRNHPDSVVATLSENTRLGAAQEWWEATASKWKSRFRDRPRSLTDLIATYPRRSYLVVTSETYMRAIVHDLREGVRHLADPDQLAIVCAGMKRIDGLDQHLVPCDARMQGALGGARRSLNTRLAAKIIRESQQPPHAKSLMKQYQRFLGQQPPIAKYNRQPLSDEEIKQFIRKQLEIDGNAKHTPMLRLLRQSQMACEQKRFAVLYREAMEAFNG